MYIRLKRIAFSIIIACLSFFIITALFSNTAENKVFDNLYYEYNAKLLRYRVAYDDYESKYYEINNSIKKQIISEQNATNYGDFMVSIDVNCDYNDSVGNEWIYRSYLNDTKIQNNSIISLPLNKNSEIFTECIESDSIDDYSSYSCYYKIHDGLIIKITMENIEGNGRYAGNTAQHTFTYCFTRYIDKNAIINRAKSMYPTKPIEPIEPIRSTINLNCIEIANTLPIIYLACAAIFILSFIISKKLKFFYNNI